MKVVEIICRKNQDRGWLKKKKKIKIEDALIWIVSLKSLESPSLHNPSALSSWASVLMIKEKLGGL